MKPLIAVIDDFLYNPEVSFSALTACKFGDYKSEFDGIVYPGICTDMPVPLVAEFHKKLGLICGQDIKPTATFARLTTPELPSAPHKVHSDKDMGDYAAHVYLSKVWPIGAGTSFLTHKEHASDVPLDGHGPQYNSEANDLSKWNKVMTVQGMFNRVLVHNGWLWHCAEPIGGWGTNEVDGRLVMTCFFKL